MYSYVTTYLVALPLATCKRNEMTRNDTNSRLLISAGRWLLALYFLVPGVMKFLAFPMHVDLMNVHKVPYPETLLIIAGVAQVLGALLLLSNRFVRFAALGLAVYIILINLLLHDFWNFDGIQARHETQSFLKNLGIMAGLLILAGASTWRMPSIKGLLRSDS